MLPGWLAALIVAAALLIITGILAAIGGDPRQEGHPADPHRDASTASNKTSEPSRASESEKPMSTSEPPVRGRRGTGEKSIASTRAQLADTLDAIEDKLNVPKRSARSVEEAQGAYEKNPVPLIIGGAAAVIVVGGLVAWAIFGDD